jgi:prepilin-type N-terminal cleavage/methylation domain-containing protein
MKGNSRGFSLIELLIVVAIILIIAAIAIPNLLRSQIAANQASAVGSLRTLNTGEITYLSTYNVETFALHSGAQLTDLIEEDNSLASTRPDSSEVIVWPVLRPRRLFA